MSVYDLEEDINEWSNFRRVPRAAPCWEINFPEWSEEKKRKYESELSVSVENTTAKIKSEITRIFENTDFDSEIFKAISDGYVGFVIYCNPFVCLRRMTSFLNEKIQELSKKGYYMNVGPEGSLSIIPSREIITSSFIDSFGTMNGTFLLKPLTKTS